MKVAANVRCAIDSVSLPKQLGVGVEIPRGCDGEADKKVMFQRGIFKVEYSPGLDGVQLQVRNISS